MKKVLFSLLTLLFINAKAQNRQWSHLYIPNINCQKTTEAGEDEIYLLVTWKTSFGSTGTVRIKGQDKNDGNDTYGHWNMNDNGDLMNRTMGSQYGFMLADGESIDYVVTIMEEDGGTPDKYLEIGKAILDNAPSDNEIVATAKVILDALTTIANVLQIKDTDDWIGSIQYHVSQNNGAITSSSFGVYNPNDNSNGINGKLNSSTGHNYSFAGDGSNYTFTTEVKKD